PPVAPAERLEDRSELHPQKRGVEGEQRRGGGVQDVQTLDRADALDVHGLREVEDLVAVERELVRGERLAEREGGEAGERGTSRGVGPRDDLEVDRVGAAPDRFELGDYG